MNRWINLEKVSVLALDESVHGCKILTQILRGFGVRNVRASTDVNEARGTLISTPIDLVIADPGTDGDGIELLRWLRRQDRSVNRFAPIILVSGHSTPSMVRRARDSGANYFVAKPLTPATLLDRILWVARDKRPFVEVGEYLGPDRRFKDDGPPLGGAGRRVGDFQIEEEQKGAART
ncbi:MAG: response regulator [Phycisphaerales bacterium]|nr:response regulator [Hyphomonadaceae bacterium]